MSYIGIRTGNRQPAFMGHHPEARICSSRRRQDTKDLECLTRRVAHRISHSTIKFNDEQNLCKALQSETKALNRQRSGQSLGLRYAD
jgi:hypothetical protein